MKRIIVGITGASGVIYGIRLLEVLKELDMETHLVLTEEAKKNILLETTHTVEDVKGLAYRVHLELMNQVADLGGVILPPVPAFYHSPRRIEDLIDHTIGKILDTMEIDHSLYKRWEGVAKEGEEKF